MSGDFDSSQILPKVYDPIENRLRVDTEIVTTISGDINIEVSAEDGDSVKIGDGNNNYVEVEPDGSINVNVLSFQGTYRSVFNEILSLGSNLLTNIISYTVPVGKIAYLQKCEYGGTNIATYEVWVDAIKIDKRRTYFSGDLSGQLDFNSTVANGYEATAGQVITLKVIHERSDPGDFEGRIQIVER